jgi:hypothetical protein
MLPLPELGECGRFKDFRANPRLQVLNERVNLFAAGWEIIRPRIFSLLCNAKGIILIACRSADKAPNTAKATTNILSEVLTNL